MTKVIVIHRPHGAKAIRVELNTDDSFEVLEWCMKWHAVKCGTYDAEFERKECARLEREGQLKGTA